jgi:PPOX class probable F420-dependent enzyme
MPDTLDDLPGSHRDILSSPLTATFTTIDPKGRPQSTAIWYLLDEDGQLKCSITSDRQKYKSLRGNTNCDLFIIDPENPYRTLEIHAQAELTADPGRSMLPKFAKAYSVDEAMLAAAGDDRYVVTLHPWRVLAQPLS